MPVSLPPLPVPPVPAVREGPPFEMLPGVFAPPELPIRWTEAPPRAAAEARTAARAPLPTGGGLAPYAGPWGRAEALHLLRRATGAATPAQVDAVVGLGAGAVDALVDTAVALPPLPAPRWRDVVPPTPPGDGAPQAEREAYERAVQAFLDANVGWVYEMEWRTITEGLRRGATPPIEAAARAFRERLAVGWHDHLVTSLDSYTLAGWLARYWERLQAHALGDFRRLVTEVGTTPAMLIYLNGQQNRAGAPNENYARELLELFTMGTEGPDGAPTYTQADVAEAARALTGWAVDLYGVLGPPLEAVFVPQWHDAGDKTVLGRTGPWDHDALVGILFEERAEAIAHHVCRKLYRDLVYDVPNDDVVAALAAVFLAEDFAIEPVVRALLGSAHFLDAATRGARVKSPLEHVLAFQAASGLGADLRLRDFIRGVLFVTDQRLFYPPTVAGWPGHRDWLTSSTLPTRWLYSESVLGGLPEAAEALRAAALALPNPYVARELVADLGALWLGAPPDDAALDVLLDVLLGGIPAYEWDPTDPGASGRLLGLAAHLARQPEHQLA